MEGQIHNLDQEINARAQQFHKEIERLKEQNLKGLHHFQQKQNQMFEEAMTSLESLKSHLLDYGKFVDILHTRGTDLDKTAYCPSLQKVVQKQCKATLPGAPTWHYEVRFEASPNTDKIDLGEGFGKFSSKINLFEQFFHLRTVNFGAAKCPGVSLVRYATLFDKEQLMHVTDKCGNFVRDILPGKGHVLCIHRDNGTKRVKIPKLSGNGSVAVIDPNIGSLVVADNGKEKAHRKGSLHWITLDQTFSVTQYDRTELECMPCGEINVDNRGDVLVLTSCTTDDHSPKLHIFDQETKSRLQTVSLTEGVTYQSAVQSATDEFTVVGGGQVMRVNCNGEVLKWLYDKKSSPYHVIQQSQRYLLISDNSALYLMTRDGEILETKKLLPGDAERRPTPAMHLNEEAGLLAVSGSKMTVNLYHFNRSL